jgi:hypothetical protein
LKSGKKTPAEVSCLLHVGGLKPGGSAGYRIGYFHEEIKPSILHIRDSPDPLQGKLCTNFFIDLVIVLEELFQKILVKDTGLQFSSHVYYQKF